MKINVSKLDKSLPENTKSSRISWDKATCFAKENYKSKLQSLLKNIDLPTSSCCLDASCKDSNHIREIDEYSNKIMESIQAAGNMTLPKSSHSSSQKVKNIPGWNEHIKPFSEENSFLVCNMEIKR